MPKAVPMDVLTVPEVKRLLAGLSLRPDGSSALASGAAALWRERFFL